ncbi:MAG: precorrin-4 C(11)-methyltransferase [Chloroflexota bacterium]
MNRETNRFNIQPGTVYIVGAGPGAPDLIAVRGKEIIEQADLILYADSLVELSVAELAKKETAEIIPSSGLYLEEMIGKMVSAAREGKVVARVHSGDPALYGATHEQMARLEDAEVPYEIIPGITAAFAAAAQLQAELTVPDVVQTIILTRTAGRTTMPEGEELQALAAPGASLAIYLSVARIKRVIEDLLASGGYDVNSPVAVLHKTTWPDESYVIGTLGDIAEKVRKAGYTKHALILVSPALDPALKGEDRRTSSHLYDKTYTHRFRRAINFKRGKEKKEAQGEVSGVVRGDKHLGSVIPRSGTAVIAVTRNGSALASQLVKALEGNPSLLVPAKFSQQLESAAGFEDSVLNEIRRQWGSNKAELVLVMPAGVATRAIAPLLKNKMTDPAVVCLDESGAFVIPLIGGHVAGANQLAKRVAHITGGVAAITTASDLQEKPALDLLGRDAGWQIDPNSSLTHTSAALVNGELIGLYIEDGLAVEPMIAALLACENVRRVNNLDELDVDEHAAGIIISHRRLSDHHSHLLRKSVLYRPPALVVGMGCKRDTPVADLRSALETTLAQNGYSLSSVSAIATADLKADEAGLIELAAALNLPLEIVSSEKLKALEPAGFSPSAAQEKFNLPGVAEPCALIVSKGKIVAPKQSFERCTVALALIE